MGAAVNNHAPAGALAIMASYSQWVNDQSLETLAMIRGWRDLVVVDILIGLEWKYPVYLDKLTEDSHFRVSYAKTEAASLRTGIVPERIC